jgi:hypothetical protein
MKMLIFDLETGPLPSAEIAHLEPDFTEKLGNLKDPAKIAAAIAEKRASWYADAALSPMTGRILAIGYRYPDGRTVVDDNQDEALLIRAFFMADSDAIMAAGYKMVGFNIHGFDLPFIIKRAWALGIPVPPALRPSGNTRFYWPPWMVDLRDVWGLGEHMPKGSLGSICKYLGLGEKSGSGEDFARLFNGSPEERAQAIAYARNDVDLTFRLAERLLA